MNLNNIYPFFDLKKYLGLWYQIATIPSWFQKDLSLVTAEYSLTSANKVKVINSGTNSSGRRVSLSGVATKTSIEGWLKVRFFLFGADYKVLKVDESYQYALVGGSSPDYLWILSRTKTIPEGIYDSYLTFAAQNGYNTQKLVKTKTI